MLQWCGHWQGGDSWQTCAASCSEGGLLQLLLLSSQCSRQLLHLLVPLLLLPCTSSNHCSHTLPHSSVLLQGMLQLRIA